MTPMRNVDTTSNSGNAHHLTNILRPIFRRGNSSAAGGYVTYRTWCNVRDGAAGEAPSSRSRWSHYRCDLDRKIIRGKSLLDKPLPPRVKVKSGPIAPHAYAQRKNQ